MVTVRAVSVAEDTPPTELPPLHDVVDTQALDALFGPSENGRAALSGSLSFEYSESLVTIEDGVEVRVESKH